MKYFLLASASAIAFATAQDSGFWTTITSAQTFTFACTATPLPKDCIANSWSNTIATLALTAGGMYFPYLPHFLCHGPDSMTSEHVSLQRPLPTVTAPANSANGTGSGVTTGTPTPTTTASETTGAGSDQKGNAVAREAGAAGVVLGGLMAGLLVL